MTKQRANKYQTAIAVQRFSRPELTAFVLGFDGTGKVVTPCLATLPIIPRSRFSPDSITRHGVPAEAWQIPAEEVSKAFSRGAEVVTNSDRESLRIFIRNVLAEFGDDKRQPKGSVSVFTTDDAAYVAVTG